jgi:transposase-like protein
MSRRRDDITGEVRAQIVLECLAAGEKRDGTRQGLAKRYGMSRQSIYNLEQQTRAGLAELLEPGGHGPRAKVREVTVTPEHVLRSIAVLADSAVSERKMQSCLEQMLGCRPSLGWISTRLRRLAERAAAVNASWQPEIGEALAADEIYCQGVPNLLVVGSESLYIYALTQQEERDGETWAYVLLDTPQTGQLARDGGTGLRAGAILTDRPDQLDWWHVLREVWAIDASRERAAYAALEQVVTRETLFDQAHTPRRLEQHLQAWEKQCQEADEAVASYDQYHDLARQVDDLFAMIDLTTGCLMNAQATTAHLQALGKQIHDLGGRVCTTLGTTLQGQAARLVAYLPRLAEALEPLQVQWGTDAMTALCRIWQAEETARRKPLSLYDRPHLNAAWQAGFEQAASRLGDDLFEAWSDLQAVLQLIWRGSNAAECVNSLLRPHFNARKSTDQPALELRRFLHNTHTFQRGKRAGYSPAELVGIPLPPDPLSLLGLLEPRPMSN